MIGARWISDSPQDRAPQIDVESGFGFCSGQHGLPHPYTSAGVICWQSLGNEPINHQTVGCPIYVQIESKAEVVIMVDRDYMLVDKAAIGVS